VYLSACQLGITLAACGGLCQVLSDGLGTIVSAGRYGMNRLKVAMLLIANDTPLGPEWLDHPLSSDRGEHRECHIGKGDFLLADKLDEGEKHGLIAFMRAGTHAELFK